MSKPAEVLVDPRVSRTKFDREIAEYRALEDTYIRQGWWLVKAEFPEVFVVFGTAHMKPHAVAFGATIDFTNYDLYPPSVKIVDPFTRVPYKMEELPTHMLRRHLVRPEGETTPTGPATTPPSPAAQQVFTLQGMMMHDPPDGEPFLCLPGTRAYHEHPSHTGDSWLLRRGRGEGKLYFLLNTLHRYGVWPLVHVVQVLAHPQRVPE